MRQMMFILSIVLVVSAFAGNPTALVFYHQTHLKMAASDLPKAREVAGKSLSAWDEWIKKLPAEATQLVHLQKAREGAGLLAAAKDDAESIRAFGVYSEGVVNYLAGDKSLQANWTRFRCPMVPKGIYSQWAQPVPETLSNPYRTDMATCGVKKPW